MAAVYLKPLDEAMEKTGQFYARFMDDWVVLDPTRWKRRKVVCIHVFLIDCVWTNTLRRLLSQDVRRPSERGFEVLGYHLKPSLHAKTCGALATAEDATAPPTNISPQVDSD